MIAVGSLAGLMLLGGCTMRSAYESVRQNARNECYRKPSTADRDRCLARTADSYDEYRRQREAVLDKPAPISP